MGLSGPRKRAKFSHDPNNTNWTRSEDKYGQRILQAQGWQPGQFLGATNAPHARHYTAANASHVRVFLRDENLGLGARPGAAGGAWQTTGLNGFENLLGRLNGRPEAELEKIQKSRADMQRKLYAEQRWGGLNFVSGGLLIGDRIQENQKVPNEPLIPQSKSTSREANETQLSEGVETQSLRKIPKKERNTSELSLQHQLELPVDQVAVHSGDESTSQSSGSRDALRRAKAERRAARAERRLQKELRRQARQARRLEISSPSSTLVTTKDSSQKFDNADAPMVDEIAQAVATVERTNPSKSRHTSRHRNIRHKKLAMMDNRALNEILMIKG